MIKEFKVQELEKDVFTSKQIKTVLKGIKANEITLQQIVNNANFTDEQKFAMIVLFGKPTKDQVLKLVVGCVKLSYRFFHTYEENHPHANGIYKLILQYFEAQTEANKMQIEAVLATVRSRIDLTTSNSYTNSYNVNTNDADTLYYCLQEILFLLYNAGCYVANIGTNRCMLFADSVFFHMAIYINKACHYEKKQERAESLHRYLCTFIEKN